MAPVEITSVSQWNTTLREAKAAQPPKTVVVDWYATWCGPCKAIAPYFDQIADKNPRTVFVRVDVDGPSTQVIAQKYKITAMPTFTAIRNGEVVERIQGANPAGLASMVQSHGTPATAPGPTLPQAAEQAKVDGNTAFSKGEYQRAVDLYTTAIQHAPQSAVLFTNRAFAYIKLAQQLPADKTLPPKALQDANHATQLDEHYCKAWVRVAEAMLLTSDNMNEVEEAKRAEGSELTKTAAREALENAIRLAGSQGNAKLQAEAEQKLKAISSA